MEERIKYKMKKFTLIELLIVVSIIGILVSLLMPALSKARHMAKFAVCKSNVSQVLKGLHLYSNSHSRKLPSSNSDRKLPKYHRYAWLSNNTGPLGKLVENNLIAGQNLFCPEANENAQNPEFKMSTHVDESGQLDPGRGRVIRTPYIFLPYEDMLSGVFVDSLEERDFLVGSTFLSKKEIFHNYYGARWNVGLLNGAVETGRSNKAFVYVQSTYSGNVWSKADFMRDAIIPD